MINYGLKDKVVIITGANNPEGIGATTAYLFAKEGAKVVLVYKKIFRKYDEDKINKNGVDRIFPIHQKLLYDKYKIIVNKVVPEVFFKQANIAPEGLRWNKNIKKEKTLKKSFIGLNSFEEFLAQSDNNLGKQINIGFLGK